MLYYCSPHSYKATLTKGHLSNQATPTKGHLSNQATHTKGHLSNQATPTKDYPLTMPNFRCTEMVKYY